MQFPLTIRRSTGLSGSICWLSSGVQGVVSANPILFVASAVFRQQTSDIPLLSLTSAASSPLGSILYLPAVTNYTYLPPGFDPTQPPMPPVLLTLYPIAISITAAGAAKIPYSYCYWELNLTSVVDGSSYPLIDQSLVGMIQT